MAQREISYSRPFLPPLDEFSPYLSEIWSSRYLTNNGKFLRRLEDRLSDYLGVQYLSIVSNGTLGLLLALKAQEVRGEVITTPFTFAATTHALLWSGLTPVFVDIDPLSLNINPEKIEQAITEKTTAIFPVHCFGRPCDVQAIKGIARANNLRVIYDAAQAFGVEAEGTSVLNHGDVSVLSLHATKVFHTLEGGGIISSTKADKKRIDQMRNFGFEEKESEAIVGINAKLNEISALVGLLQLDYVEQLKVRRYEVDQYYRAAIEAITGLHCLPWFAGNNYSYFPILVDASYPLSCKQLQQELRQRNITTKRYFHPLISSQPMYRGLPSTDPCNLPVATSVAERVLCLPIHPDLTDAQIRSVTDYLASFSAKTNLTKPTP